MRTVNYLTWKFPDSAMPPVCTLKDNKAIWTYNGDNIALSNKVVPFFYEIAAVRNKNSSNSYQELITALEDAEKEHDQKLLDTLNGVNAEEDIYIMTFIRTPLTVIETKEEPHGPETSYVDAIKMLKDILKHNCHTAKIYANDNPKNREVGFACECGYLWKTSLKYLQEIQDKDIKKMFQTPEARVKLAELLTSCDDGLIDLLEMDHKDVGSDLCQDGRGQSKIEIVGFEHIAKIAWFGEFNDLIGTIISKKDPTHGK